MPRGKEMYTAHLPAMYVIKRDGRREAVHFDKITSRIAKLCYGLSPQVEPVDVAKDVCVGVYAGVKTHELDELAAETAAHKASQHADYAKLAARLAVSNLHKQTKKSFSQTIKDLYEYVNPKTKQHAPLVSQETYDVVMKHAARLDAAVVYSRDFAYDYFGYKTLERSYLLKMYGAVVERQQHMLMRCAVGVHGDDVDRVIETYDLISRGFFTHATPTLFNAGTPNPGLSSCFLLTMADDSIQGIYKTLADCALISKSAGGIGVSVSNIRAAGSYIRGTNGVSNGLVPMLRVFNNTARYVDQGGGRRKGSFAVYLEPWHADVIEFLDLAKPNGAEELRARDLFYALWIPDLFMKRVNDDQDWCLMCPSESPGLHLVYGDEFDALYTKYESEGRFMRKVKARKVWEAILTAQIETGRPYMLYKDHVNRKNAQKNLGTIRSSNLCTEVVEYTDEKNTAVCNLASMALPKYVRGTRFERDDPIGLKVDIEIPEFKTEHGVFDHSALYAAVKVVTRNLDRVIDRTMYPTPEARASSTNTRAIGIGVQGLADVFQLLNLPYESSEAQQLNREIFETIYFASLEASCEMAQERGPYPSFAGSPASQGILQFHMWGKEPQSDRWKERWPELIEKIKKHGLRHSLHTAPMPTASTSQILGNTESFEPTTSNLYARRTLAGEFVVVNNRLVADLDRLGLWSDEMRELIIKNDGSIQSIESIPQLVRDVYKTVWEMSNKILVDMAADRGAFIDQSQSFNLHMALPTHGKLTSFHFYTWRKGLKTGMYYLKMKETKSAQKNTRAEEKPKTEDWPDAAVCSRENKEACMMCTS